MYIPQPAIRRIYLQLGLLHAQLTFSNQTKPLIMSAALSDMAYSVAVG